MAHWYQQHLGKEDLNCLEFVLFLLKKQYNVEVVIPDRPQRRKDEAKLGLDLLKKHGKPLEDAREGDVLFCRKNNHLHAGMLVMIDGNPHVLHSGLDLPSRIDKLSRFKSRFDELYVVERPSKSGERYLPDAGLPAAVVWFAIGTALVVGAVLLYQWANSLIPDVPEFGAPDQNESYRITGGNNRARPYATAPLTFGTMRGTGDYVVLPYNLYDVGDKDGKPAEQNYFTTLSFGIGRNLRMTNVRSGDTPIDTGFHLLNVSGDLLSLSEFPRSGRGFRNLDFDVSAPAGIARYETRTYQEYYTEQDRGGGGGGEGPPGGGGVDGGGFGQGPGEGNLG